MEPSVQKVIDEAQRLLAEGNRERAQQVLTRAVRHHPREPRYWYWLAQALDHEEYVIDALERALKFDPSYGEAQEHLDRLRGAGEPDPSVDWLLDEQPAAESAASSFPSTESPADTVSSEPVESEETFSFLTEEAPEPEPDNEAVPEAPGDEQDWSFLQELTGEEVVDSETPSSVESVAQEQTKESAEPEVFEWSILEELESDTDSDGMETFEAPALPQEAQSPPADEQELWRRVDEFLGYSPATEAAPPTDDRPPSPATENGAASEPVAAPATGDQVVYQEEVERGAFSFRDAPPSVAADIAVRNSLTPMTHDQVMAALDEPDARTAPRKRKGGSRGGPKLGGAGAKLAGFLKRVVMVGVLLTLLCGGTWALVRNLDRVIPESVVTAYPPVATIAAEAQLRTGPVPTPFPAPDWIEEARQLRHENDVAQAEGLLQYGLNKGNHVVALARWSELRRERPDGEAEALELAQRAMDAARTVEERALATEAFLWAVAQHGSYEFDLAQARANANQAVTEVPDSPHAHWARAIVAAMEGNEDEMQSAARLASALSAQEMPGMGAAKEAQLYLILDDKEQAVQRYEQALDETDYLSWHVALYQLLGELDRTEAAQEHLDHLLSTAPNDPGVQTLQNQ